MQHSKDFGRQDNRLGSTPQAGVVQVQAEVVKEPLRRGGHGIPPAYRQLQLDGI
jgi:hypothetical protein